jgi:hypothetical protein
MKMMMGKIRLAVLGCLLGALSVGHALPRWNPEEDEILVQFIRDSMGNLRLTEIDAVDRINAWRRENGLERERTEIGVFGHWHHCLQARYPDLAFHGGFHLLHKKWSDSEKEALRKLVGWNSNEGGNVKWPAVYRGMRQRGWRRSLGRCRQKWKKIVIEIDTLPQKPAVLGYSRSGRPIRRVRPRSPASFLVTEEGDPAAEEREISVEREIPVEPEMDFESIPPMPEFLVPRNEGLVDDGLDGGRFDGDKFDGDFHPEDFTL